MYDIIIRIYIYIVIYVPRLAILRNLLLSDTVETVNNWINYVRRVSRDISVVHWILNIPISLAGIDVCFFNFKFIISTSVRLTKNIILYIIFIRFFFFFTLNNDLFFTDIDKLYDIKFIYYARCIRFMSVKYNCNKRIYINESKTKFDFIVF